MAGFEHEAVNHSVGEYVRDMAHINGIESFWAMLKRGYQGAFPHFSEKHMGRYVGECAGRHNVRPLDTIDQMAQMNHGSAREAVAIHGLDSVEGAFTAILDKIPML